jgi:hypothetical protein
MATTAAVGGVGPTSNGAAPDIAVHTPRIYSITIKGVADLLFHAWNVEAIEEQGNAAKGSKVRTSDNLESYVYRNTEDFIVMPCEYLKMSIAYAGKSRQDPRSPRKSAFDLLKAGVVPLEQEALLLTAAGKPTKQWEFLHRARVRIQNSGITRTRPAFYKGWSCTVPLLVTTPEYISESFLHELVIQAGKLTGVGDFRPTYGRFHATEFKCVELTDEL